MQNPNGESSVDFANASIRRKDYGLSGSRGQVRRAHNDASCRLRNMLTPSPVNAGEMIEMVHWLRAEVCCSFLIDTAPTCGSQLDQKPGALPFDWTVSLAHLLGDASPSLLWLPLRRV